MSLSLSKLRDDLGDGGIVLLGGGLCLLVDTDIGA
jgi:hypothetical protein